MYYQTETVMAKMIQVNQPINCLELCRIEIAVSDIAHAFVISVRAQGLGLANLMLGKC